MLAAGVSLAADCGQILSGSPDIVFGMQVIMIPGFWLDGSSWDAVAPSLRQAGHTVQTPTLPGLESKDANREGIGLRDHVDAVVSLIDSTPGPVVLVGHSGGGAIAHAAADARPGRVTRVVYVDSGPLGDGGVINDEFAVSGSEIPLPDWSVFGAEDLVDLDDELRSNMRERAIPQPARVATDTQVLTDPRRYDVPITIVSCQFPGAMIREWIEQDHPFTAELARIKSVEIVDLPTGHWPQFTRPADLADALRKAMES